MTSASWILRKDIFEDALDTISAPFRTDMATSRPQLASLDAKQASGQHRPSKASRSERVRAFLGGPVLPFGELQC
ncbi:PREDICTED: tetratricopeptide repeat protein 39B-like isoform X2 [Myotis brandtii]|uniref:tetratricopeptide repeat protein 39B-like isoform X2 n=1 Tax=Myotis brandtii TaxID=109478 RepID=UPI0007047AB3|nr:PREDICTED: tetratricopeptide repeat protein 39B-like isoform X2 [Myotis brandtii]